MLLVTVAKTQSSLIGIEACSGAYHCPREFEKLGYNVNISPPKRIKAY